MIPGLALTSCEELKQRKRLAGFSGEALQLRPLRFSPVGAFRLTECLKWVAKHHLAAGPHKNDDRSILALRRLGQNAHRSPRK